MKKFWDFQLEKEARLWPLFFNQSFRTVAISLLSLFSAVYIYKTLLPLTGQPSLALLGVFLFFLILHLFKLFFYLLAEEFSLRFGLKKMIYLGLLGLSLCLLSFFFSLKEPLWLLLTPLFWAASLGFYWFGRHGLLIKIGRVKAFGKQLGIANALVTIFLLGVPLLGGVLVNFVGYQALFLASLVFVFLACLTLRSTQERFFLFSELISEPSWPILAMPPG
jgi:MFS family permease